MKTLLALVVGLVSLVLTVALVVAIEEATEFSLFTLTFWFIVPVGAFLVGLVPAVGFNLAARALNLKATKTLGWIMFILAGATQWAIYFARWRIVTLPSGTDHASDYVGFGEFVQLMLTNAQYSISNHGSTVGEAFTVGKWGYLIALVQFAGVSGAGAITYFALAAKPFCDHCEKYARDHKLKWLFAFGATPSEVQAKLGAHQTATVEYLCLVHEFESGRASGLQLGLFQCDGCTRYAVLEQPCTLNKQGQWTVESKVSRVVWSEPNVQLIDTFRTLQMRGAAPGAIAG